MLWEFDYGWVETRDYIPIAAMQYINERKVSEALRFIILKWSSSRDINTFTIRKLRWDYAQDIINGLYSTIEWFLTIDDMLVIRIIKTFLHGQRAHEEVAKRIMQVYLPMTNICVDHKGNIIHLPDEGPYTMQAIDKIRFLSLYRQAFIERLQEKR